MNRAIARRTAFETRADVRYFLSRLAREVRAGRIEVHAFCVLGTHFHLLVRSPSGQLAEAMRRIQNAYVRWFNRSRRRDGPLFRGRYLSRKVTNDVYRRTLVRYIDFNAVEAGLATAPHEYPHGSARWYATKKGPPWLTRLWVEQAASSASPSAEFDPDDYARAFGSRLSSRVRDVVERAISRPNGIEDDAADLVGAAPERVRDWMSRKAALADGTDAGMQLCEPAVILHVVSIVRGRHETWMPMSHKRRWDVWLQLAVALLRELSGETYESIALRLECSPTAAWTMHARHRGLMIEDPAYEARFNELARRALGLPHPPMVAPP